MKKAILVTALGLVLSTQVNAQEKELEHAPAIGFGAGAVAGALVGGPVGAVVGAVMGSFIGKVEGDKHTMAAQDAAIAKQQQTIVALNHKTANYNSLLASNEALASQIETLEKARVRELTAMNVQFRSGSAELESHFEAQLSQLAELLVKYPELEVELNGFADSRGEEADNLALSQRRVDAVNSFLIKQGVDHKRLNRFAFGESQSVASSTQSNAESNFFDRRVTIVTKTKLPATEQVTASNQPQF